MSFNGRIPRSGGASISFLFLSFCPCLFQPPLAPQNLNFPPVAPRKVRKNCSFGELIPDDQQENCADTSQQETNGRAASELRWCSACPTRFTYLSPRVHIWSVLRLFLHWHNRGGSEPQSLPGKWGPSSSWPKPPLSHEPFAYSSLIWKGFLHPGYSCPSCWLLWHCPIWKQVCHKTCLFAFTLVLRV